MTSQSKSEAVAKDAAIIEETLEAFGIKAKVLEIDMEVQSTLFCIDVAQGVKVEEVEKLSRTLAMRLSSITGNVEILAPIPGKSRIGLRLPKQEVASLSEIHLED
jgi:S-DNA-T family DNA segregation ATPase FtsK/SpoIIIE